MEALPQNKLLRYAPNALKEIRKLYDLEKPGRMKEAIDLVLNWARAQKHFVRSDFDRNFVELMIIANKGSLERTKQKIDNLCTYKELMPSFFGPFDIKTDFKEMFEIAALSVMPKMTDDYYRVLIFKGKGSTFLPKMFTQHFRYCRILTEFAYGFDYAVGFLFIIDMREINVISFLANINIMELHQATVLFFEGYGMRLKGIHIVSESKMIDGFVKLLQQILSAKLGGRIRVHKTVESLYEVVPKDYLPLEYGGKEKSLVELRNEWNEVYGASEEFTSYIAERDQFGVINSAREKDFITTEYMGLPGTFRSLVVD